ncbi:hypothetical protein [Azospirillum sp. Sh1]|uniref:hypothetical protein n=1 Tax=Azospirillum sp. Sh1 TaxID=2607285 RepID=UPI0011EE8451|nr:hypothetical protein [Azospirillum sp. Sh1]KAA0570021.1 hypothetical protein FZ029_31930 [Azospirillum sp. Sh1]
MSNQAEFNFYHINDRASGEFNSPETPYYVHEEAKKIFYVMLFKDPVTRACLNIIRVIANPYTTQEAHITIRGPYRGSDILYHRRSWKDKHDEAAVVIDGCGRFNFRDEHVVYLSSSNRSFTEDIWWKPDYQDGVLHITLYNGRDEKMADYLHKMLSHSEIGFKSRLTKLTPMSSRDKSQQDFAVYLAIEGKYIQKTVGMDLRLEDIYHLSFHSRARIIDRVWTYLLKHKSRSRL